MQLTVSVAMATFNGARFLQAQLDTIADQQRPPTELVVTDDGSTDGTLAILHAFAERAPFPVRIHQGAGRLGYRANFMRAASLCTADLIAFCDQDDLWYPTKLGIAVAAFADPDVLLWHHEARLVRDGRVIGQHLDRMRSLQPVSPAGTIGPWEFPPGFTQVFRATLRDFTMLWPRSIDFKDERHPEAHDLWFFFLASTLGRIAYCAEPQADYRQHDTNAFGTETHRVGLRERARAILEDRRQVHAQLARSAEARAGCLTSAAALSAPDTRLDPLRRGAMAWHELANLYVLRTRLYDRGLTARPGLMLRLLLRHAYGRAGFWSFGRKAMVKDAILGMVLAPAVRRWGRKARGGDPNCWRGDASQDVNGMDERGPS